jgi:hypothetical protein
MLSIRKIGAQAVLAAMLAVALFASPPSAHAQQKQRTVGGTVSDTNGTPLSGAIVYLKNDSNLTVKTYVTNADGIYRFGQVGMDADYQVWAESAGHKSNTKTISNFDTKQLWTIALKISR